MPRRSLAFASCLLPLSVAACGGGGNDAPPVTIEIRSTALLDGTVGEGGDFGTDGPVVQAGDSTTDLGYRGFLSFDLGGIPAGAEIVEARLRVVQRNVQGDPYGTLGTVWVDQVVYGNVLESGAYDRTFPLNQAFAQLSADSTLGPKEVDATAAVQADVDAPRLQSQFRLRFNTATDATADFDLANFYSGDDENMEADRPLLTITYRP